LRRVGRSSEAAQTLRGWATEDEQQRSSDAGLAYRMQAAFASFETGDAAPLEALFTPADADVEAGSREAWLWVARARLGRVEEGDQAVRQRLKASPAPSRSQRAVLEHLLGLRTAPELVEEAGKAMPVEWSGMVRRERSRVWFYVAEKRRAAGDRSGAVEAYKKLVESGEESSEEFLLALNAMGSE
jgi:hypothetical protein